MRRIASLVAVALAMVLVVGGALPAVAQEGTPAAAGGATEPTVGKEVLFVDAEGIERGLVTVSDVLDPFADYDENSPPEDGTRYVLLTLAFDATAEQPFDANPSNLLVQDADGFLYNPTGVPRPDDVVVPELQSQTLAPGNRISGVVGFQVPEDVELAGVYYQPASGRLILLADLGAAAPSTGTELRYADAEGTEGLVTVAEVLDPFEDFDQDQPPDAELRYVLLEVAFENAGASPFEADPYDLLLRDADGFLYNQTSVPRPADVAVPDLQSQTLAPGNRISGVVGFEVPAAAELTGVHYQPESGRLILLADLRSGADPEATPEGRG